MPTIRLENVSKYYVKEKRKWFRKATMVAGVENIDLTIEQGEFVFVIGSSGAGKSTLLNLISETIKPDRGRVILEQRGPQRLTLPGQSRTAMMFGKVSQEHTLIRKMTVEENLRLAARVGRQLGESQVQMDQRVDKVLGLVGLAQVKKRFPVEMSIGECRRVELARALINSPHILVLDEITANLDDDNIWDIFHVLTELNRRGTTVIMATHASEYVNIMRKRVITLVDGRVFGDVAKGRYGDVGSRVP